MESRNLSAQILLLRLLLLQKHCGYQIYYISRSDGFKFVIFFCSGKSSSFNEAIRAEHPPALMIEFDRGSVDIQDVAELWPCSGSHNAQDR